MQTEVGMIKESFAKVEGEGVTDAAVGVRSKLMRCRLVFALVRQGDRDGGR